jgi:predicted NUDIX family phosphoesterase/dephospho-CoA kinase
MTGSVYLQIAEQVLLQLKRPMSAKEIISVAERDLLLPDTFVGATPHQTLKSKLSVDIRRNGTRSRFVRTAPGRFFLRALVEKSADVYEAPPLRPPKSTEQVLVFPSTAIDKLGRFQGIRRPGKRYLRRLLSSQLTILDRQDAEIADHSKQIVTYVMVTRGDKILAYRRGAYNRTEHFLRGSDCVGFGGHVTDSDRNLLGEDDHGITQCAIRELREELTLPAADMQRLDSGLGLEVVGVLNDDSSPAGRRHFAVVFRYETSDDPAWSTPTRGEKSITRLRWIGPASDIELNDFEYWSQLCLLSYYRRLARGQASFRVRRTGPFRPPHAICVVGQIGSGKTETSDFFEEEMGYTVVNSGRVLAKILGRPAVTESHRDQFQLDAAAFIEDPAGPVELASAIAAEVEASGSSKVVVDGIRQRATYAALREEVARRVAMLYIHAPADVALRFFQARADTKPTMLDFARVREAPVEAEVPSFLEIADAVLFNWYGRDDLRRAAKRLVRELP